mgnify:CR=1 FL=1
MSFIQGLDYSKAEKITIWIKGQHTPAAFNPKDYSLVGFDSKGFNAVKAENGHFQEITVIPWEAIEYIIITWPARKQENIQR